MTRATKEQIRQRIDTIIDLLRNFATFHDVRQIAEEEKWGLSTRQLHRYMDRARRRMIATLGTKNRHKLRLELVAQVKAIGARAVSMNDSNAALRAIDMQAKLLALYPEPSPIPDRRIEENLKIRERMQQLNRTERGRQLLHDNAEFVALPLPCNLPAEEMNRLYTAHRELQAILLGWKPMVAPDGYLTTTASTTPNPQGNSHPAQDLDREAPAPVPNTPGADREAAT